MTDTEYLQMPRLKPPALFRIYALMLLLLALLHAPVWGQASSLQPSEKASVQDEGGLSADAYDIAKRTLSGDSEKVKASRKQYDLNRVHIETTVTYNPKTGDDTGSVGYAFKGVDPKILLSGIDFYRHVERDDLINRYKSRQRLRKSLIWGGALFALAAPTAVLLVAGKKQDGSSAAMVSQTRFKMATYASLVKR